MEENLQTLNAIFVCKEIAYEVKSIGFRSNKDSSLEKKSIANAKCMLICYDILC